VRKMGEKNALRAHPCHLHRDHAFLHVPLDLHTLPTKNPHPTRHPGAPDLEAPGPEVSDLGASGLEVLIDGLYFLFGQSGISDVCEGAGDAGVVRFSAQNTVGQARVEAPTDGDEPMAEPAFPPSGEPFRGTTGRNRPHPFSGLSRTSPTHSAPTPLPQKDGTTRGTSPHPPGVNRSFGAVFSFTPAYGTVMSSSPGSTKSSPSPNKSPRPSLKPHFPPAPHQTRPKTLHPIRPQHRTRSTSLSTMPAFSVSTTSQNISVRISQHCANGTTRAVPAIPCPTPTSSTKAFPTGFMTAK